MRKKILIVGGLGNMGRRYKRILKNIPGISTYCIDVNYQSWLDDVSFDGIIIATPTSTHYELILEYHEKFPDVPILCEKPISLSMDEIYALSEKPYLKLQMVNQYQCALENLRFKDHRIPSGLTYYDYFKTGNDGLYWDTINIIGLNDWVETPIIKNSSAIWTCIINGQKLTLEAIDWGYIIMIREWLGDLSCFEDVRGVKMRYIVDAHKRVHSLMGTTDD